jgi:hypothetical protein
LGWQVPDILAVAQQLESGEKAAWFRDPGENMLILTQR